MIHLLLTYIYTYTHPQTYKIIPHITLMASCLLINNIYIYISISISISCYLYSCIIMIIIFNVLYIILHRAHWREMFVIRPIVRVIEIEWLLVVCKEGSIINRWKGAHREFEIISNRHTPLFSFFVRNKVAACNF